MQQEAPGAGRIDPMVIAVNAVRITQNCSLRARATAALDLLP
jgi:hypothetical protein